MDCKTGAPGSSDNASSILRANPLSARVRSILKPPRSSSSSSGFDASRERVAVVTNRVRTFHRLAPEGEPGTKAARRRGYGHRLDASILHLLVLDHKGRDGPFQ